MFPSSPHSKDETHTTIVIIEEKFVFFSYSLSFASESTEEMKLMYRFISLLYFSLLLFANNNNLYRYCGIFRNFAFFGKEEKKKINRKRRQCHDIFCTFDNDFLLDILCMIFECIISNAFYVKHYRFSISMNDNPSAERENKTRRIEKCHCMTSYHMNNYIKYLLLNENPRKLRV